MYVGLFNLINLLSPILLFSIVLLPSLGCFTVFLFGRNLGRFGVSIVSISVLVSLTITSLVLSFGLTSTQIIELNIGNWICDGVGFDWILVADSLSVEMFLVISIITTLVVLYSTSYMSDDPHLVRFISYLLFFALCMLVLVSAGNLVQLFIGWEGVGLASFLLINFWFTRLEANRSAIKAVIFNRIGDIGFVFALVLLIKTYQTTSIYEIFTILCDFENQRINNFTNEIIGLLLFIGAIGKSAQIGLHAWLADAMEGPTPVSALLHSATMVTAGIFVLLRLSPLYINCVYVLYFISIFGCLTALLGATIATFQYDIKKIIAYSTCSQLGFMIVAFSVLNINGCFFHLVSHAFFKALLFLTAGSIIHALANEQDIRKMGGLFAYLPTTMTCMLIGFLGLTGFPFLSGFFSKEFVILYSLYGITFFEKFTFICIFISSVFTAIYSIRVLYLVFFSEYRGFSVYLNNILEPDFFMVIPLIILSVLTIFFGYFFEDFYIGVSNYIWFGTFGFELYYNGFRILEQENGFLTIKLFLSFFTVFLGFIIPYYYSRFDGLFLQKAFYETNEFFTKFYNTLKYFFIEKWFFSSIYRLSFKSFMKFSYDVIIKLIDRGLLERTQTYIIAYFYRFSYKNFVFEKKENLFDFISIFVVGLFIFFTLTMDLGCNFEIFFMFIFFLYLDYFTVSKLNTYLKIRNFFKNILINKIINTIRWIISRH